MIVIPLVAVLLLGAPQQADPSPPGASQLQSGPSQSQWTPEQREQMRQKQEQFRRQHEPMRQRAIHINELAGNIHSEADARAYVDAVAEELTGHRHMSWTTRSIRHRVAYAEYEAVTDPSRQIPEQRVVYIWNEYVREIDAPEEAIVTLAELHNLRDQMYSTASGLMWKNQMTQSLWSMPNVFAIDADGEVGNGCRAVEALKIIRDMHEMFVIVRSARLRVEKGLLASDLNRQRRENPAPPSKPVFSSVELRAIKNDNPIQPSARRYAQEHGERAYDHLLRRLFAELFPAD
jgi:hypothetical protein